MWLLKKINDGTVKYLISQNKSYTVGRKNCDILNEDPSMSRKHCTIYIAKQNECPFTVRTLTGVWVVDEQSKYGTYLKNNGNWVKINANQNTKLSNGSVIRFGLMESIWSLEYKPLVVCMSGIATEQKKKIQSIIQAIDGCMKNVFSSECTLVIVNEITLTVKVVLALIHGIPIVTQNYLQEVIKSVKNQTAFPQYEMFRPEIKEILLDKSLVSLDVNINRKELFKGKKFVIPTQKQLETLKEIITSAGGSIELFCFKDDMETFAGDNIIFIQLPYNKTGIAEDLVNSIKEITLFLKNKYGRRIVPESEIAQAVAYSSIEKYCNPTNNWFNIKIGERKQVDLGPVIVEETPLATEEPKNSPFGVIPSSATIDTIPHLSTIVESELSLHETKKSQVNDGEGLESQFLSAERKRTHSPNHHDHEFQQKKAKSEGFFTNEDEQSSSTIDNKIVKKSNQIEIKSNHNKKELNKSSFMTSNLQRQSKSVEENFERAIQNTSDFWKSEKFSKCTTKRKISSDGDDPGEQSSSKKTKIPEKKQPTFETRIDVPKEMVRVVEKNKNSDKSVPSPSVKKIRNIEAEIDFSGFFGKETNAIDDLNNTIFSLTIISPAYLKKDGSLIDPPSVPVNVKRFKKQKILSSLTLSALEENEEEPLDGDWIEPHSDRLNISVA